ncbi:MAG: hypothetical protein V5A28_08005 [Haloarculaceae archaeon]
MSTESAAGTWERVRQRAGGIAVERVAVESRYDAVAFALWSLVFFLYAVGDTGLTTVVLELGGFEANPVAQVFVDTAGYAGLVVQKALAVGILWAVWRYYPTVGGLSKDPWRLVVPAIAAVRGAQLVLVHLEHISILV